MNKIYLLGGNSSLANYIYKNKKFKKNKVIYVVKNKGRSKDFLSFQNFFKYEINKLSEGAVVINLVNKYSDKDPKVIFHSNLIFPIQIFEEISKKNIMFINLNTALLPEIKDYSLSKNLFSIYLKYKSINSNAKVIDIFSETFFGTGKHGFYDELIEKLQLNKPVTLKNPNSKRKYLHVEDLLSFLELIMSKKNSTHYRKIFLAGNLEIKVSKFVKMIKEKMSSKSIIQPSPNKKNLGEIISSEDLLQGANIGFKNSKTIEDIISALTESIKKVD